MNKAMLIGNLGADPETRYLGNGDAVTNIRIATTERWKDNDGQQQEKTEWHNCVAWRRTAEVINEYLRKGDKIFIEGRLQTRKWQDRDGNDRWTTEIVIDRMEMLNTGGGRRNDRDDRDSDRRDSRDNRRDSRQDSRRERPRDDRRDDRRETRSRDERDTRREATPATSTSRPARDDDFEDDIPF